jgi:hypothetical protein
LGLQIAILFFILINISITPFYLPIVISPYSKSTIKIVNSIWVLLLPVLVYAVFIVAIIVFLKPDVIELWKNLYIDTGLISSSAVRLLSQLYGNYPEYAILHGWAHVVIGDLFIARWVYFDAINKNKNQLLISLVCIVIGFLGPLGFLLYVIIRKK